MGKTRHVSLFAAACMCNCHNWQGANNTGYLPTVENQPLGHPMLFYGFGQAANSIEPDPSHPTWSQADPLSGEMA